jgi:hypothetical protein
MVSSRSASESMDNRQDGKSMVGNRKESNFGRSSISPLLRVEAKRTVRVFVCSAAPCTSVKASFQQWKKRSRAACEREDRRRMSREELRGAGTEACKKEKRDAMGETTER